MRRLAPRWQVLAGVFSVLFCILVSASRLYLQVHYPSDILAGIALGSGWVLGVNALYSYETRDTHKRTVLLTLPREVIEAYRRDAQVRGLEDDEVVAEVLAEHYRSLPADSEESNSSAANPRPS